MLAENASAAEFDQFPEDSHRRIARQVGELRGTGCNIDWCPGEHKFAYFGREARSVDQRHPAALAKANEIDCATKFIH